MTEKYQRPQEPYQGQGSANDYYNSSPTAPYQPPNYDRGFGSHQQQQQYPQPQQAYYAPQQQYYPPQQQYYQQPQPVYVQQQRPNNNDDCLTGLLAGTAACCCLDMLLF